MTYNFFSIIYITHGWSSWCIEIGSFLIIWFLQNKKCIFLHIKIVDGILLESQKKIRYKKGLKIIKSKRQSWNHSRYRTFSDCSTYSATTQSQTGTLGRRLPNHNDFWKQKILKVLGKPTNNAHRFEDCFLRGPVSSNGFKVFNDCIVEYLNFIGLFAKKLENLLFSEMIVIGQSSSKCPSLNSHTIIILKIRSVTHLITKVSNIMHTQINGWPSKVTLQKNKLMGDRNN